MSTVVRSYSKINLGLGIGPARLDGFHSLLTLYQTIELHDRVTVSACKASETEIRVVSNHPAVPADSRNTAWKIVDLALRELSLKAKVVIDIDKRLPVQGGLGAGSANAAAALLGLQRELSLELTEADQLALAERVGSDVPLFLLGGTVLGFDRGQRVRAMPDLRLEGEDTAHCVVAIPGVGVSTPDAFRDWDRKRGGGAENGGNLHELPKPAIIEELGRTYSSVFFAKDSNSKSGTSGIVQDLCSFANSPENQHGRNGEQLHPDRESALDHLDRCEILNDLAENSLLALVRTGIENDFEEVVFRKYPFLREIKRKLMGSEADDSRAVYAALSGSGSALFALFRTKSDALAAQRRVQSRTVRVFLTKTIPRVRYWSEMFAE